MEDTEENRKELLDDRASIFSECFDGDRFISGDIDGVTIGRDFGDWDEPTADNITVWDKQELIDEVKAKYERELTEIERLFREDE